MKNLKSKILSATAILLLSTTAFATTWGESQTMVTVYAFSPQAYGKHVASVYAHTGVLLERSPCRDEQGTYWEHVKHLKMEKSYSGQFFTKAMFTASAGECQAHVLGPVVQYWVTFSDGTKMVTPVYKIPVSYKNVSKSEDYDAQVRQLGNDFARWQDAQSTYGWGVKFGWAD